MQFRTVSLLNFLSYKTAKLQFGERGLTLLEGVNNDEGGNNGAGKSGIWDAIAWCLFGQTTRGKDVIKWGEDTCNVELLLEHKGREFFVSRTAGKTKEFFFSIDGKDVQEGTLAMTQTSLLMCLGIDFDFFKHTILFSQGSQFNFVNESNKNQKEILSKVMNVSYDEYLKQVKNYLKNKKTEVEKYLIREQVIEPQLSAARVASLKAEEEGFELERADKVEEYRKEYKEYKTKRDAVELPKEISSSVIEKINAKSSRLIALNEALRTEEANKRAMIRDVKASNCPTCKRPYEDSVDRDAIKRENSKLLEGIIEIEDKRAVINQQILELDEKDRKIRERISTIGILKDTVREYDTILERTKEHVIYWETRENPFNKQIKAVEAEQRELRRELKELKRKRGEVAKDVPYYSFWEEAFGDAGIKSFVFDLICGDLSTRTNTFLEMLGRPEFKVAFTTQKILKSGERREKFDCVITRGGEKTNYTSFSGGEQRRISLAVDIALAEIMEEQYSGRFNIRIFDEQTNYLDKDGRTDFFNMLKNLSRDREIFVIDHDSEFKSAFNKVLTINKTEGVSSIVFQ